MSPDYRVTGTDVSWYRYEGEKKYLLLGVENARHWQPEIRLEYDKIYDCMKWFVYLDFEKRCDKGWDWLRNAMHFVAEIIDYKRAELEYSSFKDVCGRDFSSDTPKETQKVASQHTNSESSPAVDTGNILLLTPVVQLSQ